MRKLFLYIELLLLASTIQVHADEQHDIRLNNYGKNKEVITIQGAYNNDICRIEVVLKEVDDNGQYKIDLNIENQDDMHVIYIFGKPYTNKQLRSQFQPSIVYSKDFKELSTKICKSLSREEKGVIKIMPGESCSVVIQGDEDTPSIECAIPLYFAKPMGYLWKRHALMDVRIESLNIIVDIKASPTYTALSKSVDKMLKTIAQKKYVVCKHSSGKKHNPNLEDQKADTRHSLDSLIQKITDEMGKFKPGSKRYKEFSNLRLQLESIDLDKIPVEKCTISDRTCSCPQHIADMNLEQIAYRMEELYLKIHNGESQKKDVIGEVKALKTHSGHIRHDPGHRKSVIDRYYNRIINL